MYFAPDFSVGGSKITWGSMSGGSVGFPVGCVSTLDGLGVGEDDDLARWVWEVINKLTGHVDGL